MSTEISYWWQDSQIDAIKEYLGNHAYPKNLPCDNFNLGILVLGREYRWLVKADNGGLFTYVNICYVNIFIGVL